MYAPGYKWIRVELIEPLEKRKKLHSMFHDFAINDHKKKSNFHDTFFFLTMNSLLILKIKYKYDNCNVTEKVEVIHYE